MRHFTKITASSKQITDKRVSRSSRQNQDRQHHEDCDGEASWYGCRRIASLHHGRNIHIGRVRYSSTMTATANQLRVFYWSERSALFAPTKCPECFPINQTAFRTKSVNAKFLAFCVKDGVCLSRMSACFGFSQRKLPDVSEERLLRRL